MYLCFHDTTPVIIFKAVKLDGVFFVSFKGFGKTPETTAQKAAPLINERSNFV